MRKARVIGIIIAVVCVLVISSTVLAVSYVLNKDVPATVTITTPAPPPPPEQSSLYTDPGCTVQFAGTLDFGSVLTTGQPVTQTLYYKTAEISQASISVSSDINSSIASFSYLVGAGYIDFTVTPVGTGTSDFVIQVDGIS